MSGMALYSSKPACSSNSFLSLYNLRGFRAGGQGRFFRRLETLKEFGRQLQNSRFSESINAMSAAKGAVPMPDRLQTLMEFAKEDPQDAFAHYGVGLEFANSGRFAEAIEWFEKTVLIDQKYSAAYYQIAQCLQKEGNAEKFVAAVRRGYGKMLEIGDQKMKFEFEKLAAAAGVRI
jgi:tetratricopeptide (TPR) repeat protein